MIEFEEVVNQELLGVLFGYAYIIKIRNKKNR